MVTADAQIGNIEVQVERTPMATTLCGDVTGKVPLKVKMGSQNVNKVKKNWCLKKKDRTTIARALRFIPSKCFIYLFIFLSNTFPLISIQFTCLKKVHQFTSFPL